MRWNYRGSLSNAEAHVYAWTHPFSITAIVVASDHLAVANAITHAVRLTIVALAFAFARWRDCTLVLIAWDRGTDKSARHRHPGTFELAGRPFAHAIQSMPHRVRKRWVCRRGGWWVDERLVRLVDRRRGMMLVVLRGTGTFVGGSSISVAGVGTLAGVGGAQHLCAWRQV